MQVACRTTPAAVAASSTALRGGWESPSAHRNAGGAAVRAQRQPTVQPPSMAIAWPVTNAASSDASQTAICAISPGVPRRPIG